MLKVITLRNLPPDLAKKLEEEAASRKTSLAKTVIQLLQKVTGLGSTTPSHSRFHDLDDLAGTWSQQEADAFERTVTELRPIDRDIWD